MRWLDSITDSMEVNLSKFWEIVKDIAKPVVLYSPRGCKESDRTEQLNDTTEIGCANILEGFSHPTLTAQ